MWVSNRTERAAQPKGRRSPGGPLSCIIARSCRRVRLQAYELVEQRAEARTLAGMQVDAAYLLDQPLERLELLEPHQQRVLLHQLRGVEERTRCRGLLLAADQV